MQLGGRQGVFLPVLGLLLLTPAAVLKWELPETPPPPPEIRVSGDVPEAVKAVPSVVVADRGIRFKQVDGVTHVVTSSVPDEIRAALDGDDRTVTFEPVRLYIEFPGRMLWIALIAGSLLTGGTSESLPGERSRKTLETLLSAAITRGELVVGKWLAWSAIGVSGVTLAAILALALGRVTLGMWVFPLLSVPAAVVAFSFYLVRRTSDVIGASAVTLRVMPVVLASLGIAALIIGFENPLLGAAIPLGGAVVAAGGSWPGVAPPLVATLITGSLTLISLGITARDLTADDGPPNAFDPRFTTFAGVTTSLMIGHWIAVAGPVLWASAGNPRLAGDLSPAAGVLASALLTGSTLLWAAGRDADPAESIGLVSPPRPLGTVLGAVVGAIVGQAVMVGSTWAKPSLNHFLAMARDRMTDAVSAWWTPSPAILLIVAQELAIHGFIARRVGRVPAGIAFALVVSPFDPVRGILLASVLGILEWATGTVYAPLLARLGMLALSWAVATG